MQRKNATLKFKIKVFKALGDPFRLQIVEFLRDGEKCVCEITPYLKVLQPVASRHLKILKDAGLVKDRKNGNRRLYSLTDIRVLDAIGIFDSDFMESIFRQALQQVV